MLKLSKLGKNKKAQYDTIAWIASVVVLLILAPILFKVVNTSLTSFSTAINNTSPVASENVDTIKETFTGWLDYIIMIGFLMNIVLLFVFAFMVDTHPLFLVFYIISSAFIMMFAPYVIEPIKQIFGMAEFGEAVVNLPLTEFVVTRFNIILLGVIVVAGIIMYAKLKGGGTKL